MASELWVRDAGGTPRKLKELWIRDGGGVARLIKELWARDGGGVARMIFQYFTVATGAAMTSTILTTSINPQIRLQTDGTTLKRLADNSTTTTAAWGAPTTAGIGANYWIIVVLGAGIGVITGSLGSPGSPISLGSEYVLTMTAATVGNVRDRAATYTIYSDAGGVTAVGSGTMFFSSDRS